MSLIMEYPSLTRPTKTRPDNSGIPTSTPVPLLDPTDEDASGQLGDTDLDPGLADTPDVRCTVVHVAEAPGDGTIRPLESTTQEKSSVADTGAGAHLPDLLLVRLILGVGGEIQQERVAEPKRGELPVELIPFLSRLRRWHREFVVAGLGRFVDDVGSRRGGVLGVRSVWQQPKQEQDGTEHLKSAHGGLI
jgi:hypothetical protein